MNSKNIEKGSVVGMSYQLKNDKGEELDRADLTQPFYYLHGFGNIVPGLENALTGLSTGDIKEVAVIPSQGYGDVIPELCMTVERESFPPDVDIQPGMQFSANINGQAVPFTVEDVNNDEVTINGNHPLAGVTLHFRVQILSIRESTAQEQEHGHVHPEGISH